MAISELTKLVSAPETPVEIGPRSRWDSVQRTLSIELPSDLRDFGKTYGTGTFLPIGIAIYNPFSREFLKEVHDRLNIYRELAKEGKREVPFALYPERPGLFPWGWDEGGAGLFWLTEGAPDSWPIIIRSHDIPNYQRFAMPLTTFLAKLFKKDLETEVWSSEWVDKTRFQPEPR